MVESLAFAKVAQPESSDGLIKIYNTFGEYITSGYVCKDLSAKNTMVYNVKVSVYQCVIVP